jgi:hypothetical protein
MDLPTGLRQIAYSYIMLEDEIKIGFDDFFDFLCLVEYLNGGSISEPSMSQIPFTTQTLDFSIFLGLPTKLPRVICVHVQNYNPQALLFSQRTSTTFNHVCTSRMRRSIKLLSG